MLVDSNGRTLAVEKEMFRGGEGTVHPVIGDPTLFAKLYHGRIDAPKQAKLSTMTRATSDALLRVAAWPSATLHDGAGGRMVGFVMPRFDGQRSELHYLYRPGTRKQTFRQADWSFLLHAARNVAAAMDTVHAAGHVVGDVNQRNFIVGGDATVKVLDCDSFQIRGAGQLHYCPVGVPEFTPPELQKRVLDGIERTPNHDAFGLAVLVFQLLFMGRHPFAGRFLGAGDMPIERAIAEGRFAFGRNSKARGMEPPPGMVPFESLPPRLAALFEAAFGGGARPTAKNWTEALDKSQSELRKCSVEPMHKYYDALPECTWCALERTSGVLFFIGVASGSGNFDLAFLWGEIMTSTALRYEAPPRPAMQVTGAPMPLVLTLRRRAIIGAKVAGVIMLVIVGVVAPEWIALLLLALAAIALTPLPGSAEREERQTRLRIAEQTWLDEYKAAERAVSIEPLLQKRLELQRLKTSYENVDAEKQKELTVLAANARHVQLHHYLERQLIRAHDIPDVGPKRKATLAAWGIDSAADVSAQALAAVQGFGPTLQSRLLAWRMSLEARFVFDAARAIPRQDVDAIEYRWRRRKAELEQQLRTGAEEARRANLAIRKRRETLAKELELPARHWAQARADVDAANRALSFRGGNR